MYTYLRYLYVWLVLEETCRLEHSTDPLKKGLRKSPVLNERLDTSYARTFPVLFLSKLLAVGVPPEFSCGYVRVEDELHGNTDTGWQRSIHAFLKTKTKSTYVSSLFSSFMFGCSFFPASVLAYGSHTLRHCTVVPFGAVLYLSVLHCSVKYSKVLSVARPAEALILALKSGNTLPLFVMIRSLMVEERCKTRIRRLIFFPRRILYPAHSSLDRP